MEQDNSEYYTRNDYCPPRLQPFVFRRQHAIRDGDGKRIFVSLIFGLRSRWAYRQVEHAHDDEENEGHHKNEKRPTPKQSEDDKRSTDFED